jgi:hypothetical protein
MKAKVYLETTVVSYLTALPSRDVVVLGRQEVTRERWDQILKHFDPFISVLVMREIEKGAPDAAQKRLDAVKGLSLLEITGKSAPWPRLLIPR